MTAGFDFGTALKHLKDGKRVARSDWAGAWLRIVRPGEPVGVEGVGIGSLPRMVRAAFEVRFEGIPGTAKCLPWIGLKTVDGGFVPWAAPITDLLAEDWSSLEADEKP